jgi:hypothetical protein
MELTMSKDNFDWLERVAERAEKNITPENPELDYDRAAKELTLEDYITDIYTNEYRRGAWAFPYDLLREIQKKYKNKTYTNDDVKTACIRLYMNGDLETHTF